MSVSPLYLPAPLIFAALALDAVAGDPSWLPHPVVLIGGAITWGERRLRKTPSERNFLNGLILAAGVITVAAGAAWGAITLCGLAAPWLASVAATLIAWTALALRGLDDASKAVEFPLRRADEASARIALRALVGRDPDKLDQGGIIGATIESVAENLSDGIVAPLFYLFVGGPVGAISYKAINTLDSMIGYRDERYLFFGRAAARIDDVANYLPARWSAGCIALAAALSTKRGRAALLTCWADAGRHSSPNAGYPEAAMAGALGIQLGGDAVYDGKVEHRSVLGVAERALRIDDITVARRVMRVASAIAFIGFALIRNLLTRM